MLPSRFASLFVFAATLLPGPPVGALDIDQCAPVDVMTALLKAEGQQSVASGSGRAERSVTALPISVTVILSTDPAGSRGYVLQTDRQPGKGATTMCVRNRLADVRLYDVHKPGPPPDVFVKASREAAEKYCDSLFAGTLIGCGLLNDILVEQENAGGRVLMQARNQQKNPDGSYASDGVLMTVVANLTADGEPTRSGMTVIDYTTPEGATFVSRVFFETEISENAKKLIATNDRR